MEVGLSQVDAHSTVVIIRVPMGDYPPYEFTQGPKIPIRSNDSVRPASLREIEDLLRRRAMLIAGGKSSIDANDLYCTYKTTGGEARQENFHQLLIQPRAFPRIRLDHSVERKFEDVISQYSPWDLLGSSPVRGGRYLQCDLTKQGSHAVQRKWRLWSNGTIGFVCNINRRGSPGEYIGDLAADLLFFFDVAHQMFDHYAIYGSFVITDTLACPGVTFVSNFPNISGKPEMRWSALQLPSQRPSHSLLVGVWSTEIDGSLLQQPSDLVSDILLYQLRETCGANLDFETLKQAVQTLREDLKEHGAQRLVY